MKKIFFLLLAVFLASADTDKQPTVKEKMAFQQQLLDRVIVSAEILNDRAEINLLNALKLSDTLENKKVLKKLRKQLKKYD